MSMEAAWLQSEHKLVGTATRIFPQIIDTKIGQQTKSVTISIIQPEVDLRGDMTQFEVYVCVVTRVLAIMYSCNYA